MNTNIDIDIASVVSMLYLQNAEDKGTQIKASCPSGNHADSHPSWSINKSTGQHHCFACGFSGNIHTLVRHLTGQSLYKFLDIEDVPSFVFKQSSHIKPLPVRKSHGNVNVTKGVFVSPHSNAEAEAEILKRGMNDSFIDFFKIKYTNYAIINDTYFIKRLCIPIVENKKVISMEGRLVEKSDVFKKVLYPRASSVDTLFNIDKLNFDKPIFLVEGIMDTIKVWQSVSKNVTCTFGVALSKRQKELIEKINKLILVPDNDEGGQKLITQIDEIATKEYDIVTLPFGKDPGDCSLQELSEAIDKRKSSVLYFAEKYQLFKEEEKIQW